MDIQAYIQSGIIESYVLGLASPEEIAEVDTMRLQFDEVDEAVNQFSLALEKQAFANAIQPPAGLRESILASLKEEDEVLMEEIPKPKDNEEHIIVALNSIRPWRMLAAASVILLIVSAALNVRQYQQFRKKDEAYQALLQERTTLQTNNQVYQTKLKEWTAASEMMADTGMAMIKMKGTAGKEQSMATIFWDTRSKDVFVMPNKLPHPSDNKQYQLWALVDGKPIDAGILDPNCEGVCKMKNIPRAQAFAITLENKGGSPAPTLSAMYVLGNV